MHAEPSSVPCPLIPRTAQQASRSSLYTRGNKRQTVKLFVQTVTRLSSEDLVPSEPNISLHPCLSIFGTFPWSQEQNMRRSRRKQFFPNIVEYYSRLPALCWAGRWKNLLNFFKLNLFNFYSLSALGGEDRPARHVRKVLSHPGSNFSHQDASPNPEAAKQTSEHNQN